MEELSKTQVDRLGDRLRDGSHSEADLILLDKYRQSFDQAYQTVLKIVRQNLRDLNLSIEPSGRSAKTKESIIDKLRRESIRLTQMQDIAGCRAVLPNIIAQEEIVSLLVGLDWKEPQVERVGTIEPAFLGGVVIDRRINPSHGYRAVHIVVKIDKKLVEVQIRTELQHQWAILSEKFADVFGSNIKYGGAAEPDVSEFVSILMGASEFIASIEEQEQEWAALRQRIRQNRYPSHLESAVLDEWDEIQPTTGIGAILFGKP